MKLFYVRIRIHTILFQLNMRNKIEKKRRKIGLFHRIEISLFNIILRCIINNLC